MKPKEFAQRLGETFAVIQHGADLGVEWALKKVNALQEKQEKEERELRKKIAEARGDDPAATPKEDEDEDSLLGKALGGARTFFHMLTDIGESYYKRYGEIKKDASKK